MEEPEIKEIKDFEMRSGTKRDTRKKKNPGADAGTGVTAVWPENAQMLLLFVVLVAAILICLLAVLLYRLPAAAVCVIVVLEALIALCLHDVPIWLHGLVTIIQLVAGILLGKAVFMIFCVILYVLMILTLRRIRGQHG